MKYALCYITTPDKGSATSIAASLVESHLVACANIVEHVRSVYEWKGTLETSDETLILCKTLPGKQAEIIKQVKAMHPYDCPCITFLPIADGYPPFLAWISAQCEH